MPMLEVLEQTSRDVFVPLTIGGGTGDVQRNIVSERVLDLPHDIDVEAGRNWAEAS